MIQKNRQDLDSFHSNTNLDDAGNHNKHYNNNDKHKMNIIKQQQQRRQNNNDDDDGEEEKKMNDDDGDGMNDNNDINELMDTINNMMNRAGLNLDKTKQEMMTENLRLRKNF